MSENPMRDFISLSEASLEDSGQPLAGTLNPNMLADYLPDLTDKKKFVAGVRKVMKNEEEKLNRWELEQLGRAFVSLIRDDPTTKMKAIRRMMGAHLKDVK